MQFSCVFEKNKIKRWPYWAVSSKVLINPPKKPAPLQHPQRISRLPLQDKKGLYERLGQPSCWISMDTSKQMYFLIFVKILLSRCISSILLLVIQLLFVIPAKPAQSSSFKSAIKMIDRVHSFSLTLGAHDCACQFVNKLLQIQKHNTKVERSNRTECTVFA